MFQAFLQRRQFVTQLGGLFKRQFRRGLCHLAADALDQVRRAPFQKQHHLVDKAGIEVRIHLKAAGPVAGIHLVVQAGPRALVEFAVLALAQLEGLVDDLECFPRGLGRCVRAEIAGPVLQNLAADGQVGKRVADVETQDRIAFVILEDHVVARTMALDQVGFEQQRLLFGSGDDGFEIGNAGHQRAGLGVGLVGACKIAGQPLFQVFGLAHIDCPSAVILHQINPGGFGCAGEFGF